MFKNIDKGKVLLLRDEIDYQEGQVVSKTIVQNQTVNMTLFAFTQGEEISAHKSDGDALVLCLDGRGKITIEDEDFMLDQGEFIIMPAGSPHAVYAEENFKMLLIVSF